MQKNALLASVALARKDSGMPENKWQTKSEDDISLYIDKEGDRYTVEYSGLVGYDAVIFHCSNEEDAKSLFEALLNVNGVEAD